MLGWLVHLCIFRMKIILRHLRFKFQAQFILFFIQLSLGWLACHPRAFADCPLLCTSPLRSSCSLHLLLLLSSQPDFRGCFITILEKVFWWTQDTSSPIFIRGHQQSRNRSPCKPLKPVISSLFGLFFPFSRKKRQFIMRLLLSHKEEKFSFLSPCLVL